MLASSALFILTERILQLMYQLLILIPISVNLTTLDEGWPNFLETAESMEGLIRESVSRIDSCIYGQNNIQRMYSFIFKDRLTLEQALLSPPGEKAGKIIHELTGGEVILLRGPFNEDSLDRIKSWDEEQ
jgi:hypothetical protein